MRGTYGNTSYSYTLSLTCAHTNTLLACDLKCSEKKGLK
jgi:hypothetical protein